MTTLIASGSRIRSMSLFNNPEMSDVRFLVDGKTVYGHKLMLGLGSPVFKSMFYGELWEQREVIEIPDLTLIGFKNALSYIYGFDINFDPAEIYESYMAADKYLVYEFRKDFPQYIRRKLTAENSCLIYEQLMKIGDSEWVSLAHVRATIMHCSKQAFESEYFKQIEQETLIRLLSLDELSIDEFHLFKAVSKWVDCELQRQGLPKNGENRRRVFEPIKGYILFTALKFEQIANCSEIIELLTEEERGSVLLHRLNSDNRLMIQPKTARKVVPSKIYYFVRESPMEFYEFHEFDPESF